MVNPLESYCSITKVWICTECNEQYLYEWRADICCSDEEYLLPKQPSEKKTISTPKNYTNIEASYEDVMEGGVIIGCTICKKAQSLCTCEKGDYITYHVENLDDIND